MYGTNFNKVLKVLGISYVSYKILQEQEEEQKMMEEENEAKQIEMMAFLEKQTGEKKLKKNGIRF